MRRLLQFDRLLTLFLAAGCAAIAAYWIMVLTAPAPAVAPAVVTGAAPTTDTRAAATLFGSGERALVVAAATNVQVLGVLTGERASAVVSVDGRPARAIAVGDEAQPGMRLVEVTDEQVVFEQDGRRVSAPAPAKPSLEILNSAPATPGAAISGGTTVLSNPDTEGADATPAPPARPGAARGPSAAAALQQRSAAQRSVLPPYGAAATRPGVSSGSRSRSGQYIAPRPRSAVRATPPRAAPRQD
ncbi:MAG: hypothetical protein JSW68_09095 [Burkholderiales bacterium]|nr:MAG: hypothetical protein JSW68_09095 [Burkholderiales bacterium]